MEGDTKFAARAVEIARRGAGRTFPNPLVGAVIVRNGEIVGEGYHARAGLPHAETIAIGEAGDRARNAVLYLNLEPCCHFGRTPPCTDAIIDAGIGRVVFGIYDPDPRVRGAGAARLRDAGIEVDAGVLAGEAVELNLGYVHRMLSGRPLVTLKIASTLDGRITTSKGGWITGEAARRHVHELRALAEAVGVGIGTIESDDPRLDRRLFEGEPPPPTRVVFDTGLRFPPDHTWLRRGEPVLLFCGLEADPVRRAKLGEAGAEVIAVRTDDCRLDIADCIERLAARGLVSLLVEGGGEIASTMIEEGVFDRLVIYYAPLVAGMEQLPFYGRTGEPPWLSGGALRLGGAERLGEDVVIVYERPHVAAYRDTAVKEGGHVHGID